MKTVLIGLIGFYKAAVSPLLGSCCRFAPSCSVYATQAIEKKGAWAGFWCAAKRILKCHPFHDGGWDPVE